MAQGTATAPVKKQLILREGGLDFLFLKRTFLVTKTFRDFRFLNPNFLSLKRQQITNKCKK